MGTADVQVLSEALDRALGEYADRPTVTVEEAAELLGLGRSSAYEAVRVGQIPSVRIGRRVVVPVPALARMLLAADADTMAAVGHVLAQTGAGDEEAG